jgi:hypothetical protein
MMLLILSSRLLKLSILLFHKMQTTESLYESHVTYAALDRFSEVDPIAERQRRDKRKRWKGSKESHTIYCFIDRDKLPHKN